MSVTVKTKENKQLERMLKEIFNESRILKVGVLADPEGGGSKASDPKKVRDSNGTITDSPKLKNYEIAAVHEYGSEKRNIPQRSFLRSTYNESRAKIESIATALLKADLKDNDYNPDRVMHNIGNWMVGQVKSKFTKNTWPKLKDPTRGGKNKAGLATPLVDTDQLRASISYSISGDK